MKLQSPAFKHEEDIPSKYTSDGEDVSPELHWSQVPEGTKSFAIISHDPDAPSGDWTHWVIFNIPATEVSIEEGTPAKEELHNGAKQGRNSFENFGYQGPCPPSGRHRYFFKLYALDVMLSLPVGATRHDLEKGMEGHILDSAELLGVYQK